MPKHFIILIALPLITMSAFAQPDTAGKYFTVLYKTGKNWNADITPDQQLYFKEHSIFLAELRKQDIIKVGARYGDTGMIIIKHNSLVEAEKLIMSDMAVKNELFAVAIFEASFFYRGCIN